MTGKLFLIFLSLAVLALSGCYYDVEENLYPENVSCNTDSVTYNLTVRPILDQDCMNCHDQAHTMGNIRLETYSDVLTVANSGQLVGAISHDPSYPAMPQGKAKLDDCTILKIETWVLAGSPNN